MDIFVIHGEYALKSYERLQQYLEKAKKKNWEIVNIGENFAATIRAQDLFGRTKIYILKDLKLLDKKLLPKLDGNLIVYSNDKLSDSALKSLGIIKKIEEFKLPKTIFNFLDSCYPGNSQNCLVVLHQITQNEPIEFVFSLLGKTIRDLYWVKTDFSSMPYTLWRVEKLKRQASHFSLDLLKEISADLAEIDIQAKTSVTSLLDSLDLLIIKKLE